MDTTPTFDARAARGSARPRADQGERRVRHSCGACGQAFTLHYTAPAAGLPLPDPNKGLPLPDHNGAPVAASAVPCMNDGCGAAIEVLLPLHAFALWTEEF